ncbi:acyltransferase family protein [Bifidobacterium boum]|uniref:acyltransferase family protein n=1 Tax=Bifidobacterium boum TaxID=78343 RepID=UPI003F9052BA
MCEQAKHVLCSHEIKRRRNSSIELLRIIAAYFIVSRHFVGGNAVNVWNQPVSFYKIFFEGVVFPFGKVGVVLFFFISAWFLCEKDISLRQSFKRVWILEREILFYSIILTISFYAYKPELLSARDIAGCIFPISTNLWWYPTSYVVFLLLHPFVTIGLRALGHDMHWKLCVLSFVLWSVLGGIVSFVTFDMTAENVMIFIYLYILISYWRWYGFSWLTRSLSVCLLVCGIVISVTSVTILSCVTLKIGSHEKFQTMMGQNEWMFPIVLISIGIFSLMKEIKFYSRIINSVAKSTFAVYLISAHPAMSKLLWADWFNMSNVYGSLKVLVFAFTSTALVFLSCILLDYIRRGLFIISVDRHPGYCFDILWQKNSICNHK